MDLHDAEVGVRRCLRVVLADREFNALALPRALRAAAWDLSA